jgi:GNAT superfamily N-acetyltransferase
VTQKRHAAAPDRNREPILNVLATLLSGKASVLEIGSGTGQHAAFFTAARPGWSWQPTDANHARRGIARAILERCEEEAKGHGFRGLELMATLPGIEFYKSCGFVERGDCDLELVGGVKLELVPMRKEF